MLAGKTVGETAKAMGVSQQVVSKWHMRPDFRAELKRYRDERREALSAQLEAAGADAVAVLVDLMNDPKEDSKVRRAAAKDVLSIVIGTRTTVRVEDGADEFDDKEALEEFEELMAERDNREPV